MRRTSSRYRPWLVFVVLLVCTLAASWAISIALPRPERDDFNVVGWELRHVPGKWLYLIGEWFEGGLSPAEEDERLGRFLELSEGIRRLEHAPSGGDPAQRDELERLRRERDELENDVEAIMEGRITSVLESVGLESSLPLFPDARWVFPPVDVEFDQPPQVLSVSPRERIELIERRPLRANVSLEEIIEVEQEVEREGRRSALVEPVSGAATYPSIVAPQGRYEGLVETVAHEWVHQYLFFKPLGRRFYASLELRTLNETVATLAGEELAALAVQRYPLSRRSADEPAAATPAVDVGAALRALRLEVEALLSRGEIEAAEALMEQRRRELAGQGVVFRRINQAFFAFRDVYATDPASIDPLGEKVRGLRQRTGSVGAFLRAAARLTGEADLEQLLKDGR